MILGVLLAAGTGSRFEASGLGEPETDEGNKLLADLDGRPVVAHAARTLTESRLDEVVAVIGHERERVADALPDEIDTVANPDYEQGQSSSVRQGIATARERDVEAVVFALGDMPRVSAETVDALLREYETASGDVGIVAPRFDGRRGNPALFDARYFDALAQVDGDRGGRDLLESEPVTWVDVDDPGVHRDVDTLTDLRDLRNRQERQDESESPSGSDESESNTEPESDPDRG